MFANVVGFDDTELPLAADKKVLFYNPYFCVLGNVHFSTITSKMSIKDGHSSSVQVCDTRIWFICLTPFGVLELRGDLGGTNYNVCSVSVAGQDGHSSVCSPSVVFELSPSDSCSELSGFP